jgi:hypothetical protein
MKCPNCERGDHSLCNGVKPTTLHGISVCDCECKSPAPTLTCACGDPAGWGVMNKNANKRRTVAVYIMQQSPFGRLCQVCAIRELRRLNAEKREAGSLRRLHAAGFRAFLSEASQRHVILGENQMPKNKTLPGHRTPYRNSDAIGLLCGCDGCTPSRVNGVLCHEAGCAQA